ncbi:MAG TPA: glycosyltransferase [Vicinamibacterales bacterium]|nr:glycosyltransferase [Vicinamibacterales bacterium]
MTDATPASSAERRLRILYLAMQWDYGDPARGRSFEHDNFHPALREWRRTLALQHFDFMALGQAHGLERMSRMLLDEVQRFQPDVLFGIWFNEEHDPDREAIRTISRTTPCRTVGWFCDSHWRYSAFDRPWADYLDFQVTTSQSAYARFVADGLAARVIKSQWGAAPTYRRLPEVARDVDVSFVGQCYGTRADVIEQIRRAGVDVRVFGAGWPPPTSRLSFEGMVRLFNRSKINLNLNNAVDASFKQIKGRNFEVPGCGGFLLTETAENLDEYFRYGEEVETYAGVEELVEKIRRYLADADARERIAAAGHRRTVAEHTYAHRFDEIFARVAP